MNKFLPILSLLTVIGCSDSSTQDAGSTMSVDLSGLSEDGYVAGATVWHDVNNDRTLNSGEPSAKTDSEGYFSQSRLGINYCADNATSAQKESCLQIQVAEGEVKEDVIIRTQGGIDILTGEDFVGSISIKTDVTQNGVNTVVATPITAILSHMSDAEALIFAQREGLTSANQLKVDFLEFTLDNSNATESQAKLMRSALQAHKTIELLNSVLLKRYDNTIGELGLPSDASDFVYEAFTSLFVDFMNSNPGKSLNDFVTGPSSTIAMSFVLTNADKLLRAQLVAKEKIAGTDFPAAPLDIASNSFISQLASKSTDVSKSINATMDINNFAANEAANNPLDTSKAFAKAKIVEAIKETVIDKIESTTVTTIDAINFTDIDTQFTNAVKLAGDENITDIFETAGDGLLISELIAAIPSNSTTFDATVIQQAVTSNTRNTSSKLKDNVLNKKMQISNNKTNESGSLLFFFTTGEDISLTNQGNLELCVQFDSDTTGTTTGADDTEGSFYNGTWNISKNEYVLQLTINISGSDKNITITSLGFNKDANGNEITPLKRRYRADYDGDPSEWEPKVDLENFGVSEKPSEILKQGSFADSNAVCRSILSAL